VSYNTSGVKNGNATSSLVGFQNKIVLFCFQKHSTLVCTTLALNLVVVNSEVVGLASGLDFTQVGTKGWILALFAPWTQF
jgi:hypothetical protein